MALSKVATSLVSYDMELNMICEEEPIDATALEVYQRIEKNHILVEKLIEEARKNGVEIFYISSLDEMPNIPLPPSLEGIDLASVTPDVIVLEDEVVVPMKPPKPVVKQVISAPPAPIAPPAPPAPPATPAPPAPAPLAPSAVIATPARPVVTTTVVNSPAQPVLGRIVQSQSNIVRLPTTSPAVTAVKRPSTSVTGAPPVKSSKTDIQPAEQQEPGTLVPLEEYYYGKQEGDPTYREEKGEYRFKCWYCHKMLYNNVRIMMHMQGHIDSEKQQNIDLSDLTQCKHCYKQLDTPFEMQRHIEQVHLAQSNPLVCRICEKDHKNEMELRAHMRQLHRACEMPYICQLCNFRSSFYCDVVDHFKKRHDSSTFVACLYCLKVFQIRFSKSGGWGLTQNFYFHLQKHQTKAYNKKCACCKLTFSSKEDVAKHSKDHASNYRGIIHGGSTIPVKEKVMIAVPQKGAPANSNQSVKSLNAPAVTKVLDMQGVRMYGLEARHMCLECQQPMMVPGHFKRFVECSLCRFASTCNQALSMHMMSMHSGIKNIRFKNFPWERKMPAELYCLCGYSTYYGNLLANHLIQCSKRTAYTSKPDVKWIEYDDEQEEFDDASTTVEDTEPLEDGSEPNIFGALGLVKKGMPAPKSRKVHQLTDNVASTSASKVEANQAPDSTTTIDTPSKLTRNKVSIMQGGPFKRDTKDTKLPTSSDIKACEETTEDVEMSEATSAISSNTL